jgi:lipopolysaccharide biosynthesis glycosyltransferase
MDTKKKSGVRDFLSNSPPWFKCWGKRHQRLFVLRVATRWRKILQIFEGCSYLIRISEGAALYQPYTATRNPTEDSTKQMQSVTKQYAEILHQNSILATVHSFQAGF